MDLSSRTTRAARRRPPRPHARTPVALRLSFAAPLLLAGLLAVAALEAETAEARAHREGICELPPVAPGPADEAPSSSRKSEREPSPARRDDGADGPRKEGGHPFAASPVAGSPERGARVPRSSDAPVAVDRNDLRGHAEPALLSELVRELTKTPLEPGAGEPRILPRSTVRRLADRLSELSPRSRPLASLLLEFDRPIVPDRDARPGAPRGPPLT